MGAERRVPSQDTWVLLGSLVPWHAPWWGRAGGSGGGGCQGCWQDCSLQLGRAAS